MFIRWLLIRETLSFHVVLLFLKTEARGYNRCQDSSRGDSTGTSSRAPRGAASAGRRVLWPEGEKGRAEKAARKPAGGAGRQGTVTSRAEGQRDNARADACFPGPPVADHGMFPDPRRERLKASGGGKEVWGFVPAHDLSQ